LEHLLCFLIPVSLMTAASALLNPYHGYRFPSEVIAHAVWLHLRFPLSFRDVEELLAKRAIRVTYETVRCWVAKFGAQFEAELRKREARPGRIWHLDEMAVRIGGKRYWLWRAVDEHGATLDVLLQAHRDTGSAERFFQVLLGHAGAAPERINTDKLASYVAALRRLPELAGVDHQQVRAVQRCNDRVEQAHQPTRIRERRMGRFRCVISARRFLSAFTRTWNLFRPNRRSFTTPEYRTALQDRFAVWQAAAGLRV
jgi:putative transposase